MTNDSDKKLKIIDINDFSGVLAAARSSTINNAAIGCFDETKSNEQLKKGLAKRGIVEFTDKEIRQMPKTFKKLILIQKKRCRLRTRASGKETTTYEIRYRRDGYDVSASGKTIELAKANFIEKLKTARPIGKEKGGGDDLPTTFSAFAFYYFENFRKERVTPQTYKFDILRFKKNIQPHFGEKELNKITPSDCKNLLEMIGATGKTRTAIEIYSLLSVIFKCAIAHGLINRSPLVTVQKPQHERESGKALTKAEEATLFTALKGSIFEQPAALALYTGLRPNELKTAQVQGNFIKAINSKRKHKKTEYKRIPIIDKLRPFLPVDGVFQIPHLDALRNAIKTALPGHKLYDLRTTFYTRCDELGVSPPARDHFVGHSSGTLTNAYRDLSDEYLLNESKKLNLW